MFPTPPAVYSLETTAIVTSATTVVYFDENDDMPFDEFPDIELVLLWMKKMAYEKQDADAMDLSRALAFEEQYNTRVVKRKSERYRQRRPAGRVMFSW